MERAIVYGDSFVVARLPADTVVVPPGVSLALPPVTDLAVATRHALEHPLDTPPLRSLVRSGDTVTIAFDDPTVPCYAPVWPIAIPLIISELTAGGVARDDITLVCANALHRRFTDEELAKLIGEETVRDHAPRLRCHDAEDHEQIVSLGATRSGYAVELARCVTEADLTVYLNCSTTRGFSGGWKSVCVGLSTYRSIHQHHSPDVMSMSLDGNRMHEILDEMGAVVEATLGERAIFKLETVLANPLQVHAIYSGTVRATRAAVLDLLRASQPPRRALVPEPVDVIVYGVPDWSPYAAYAHGNPILDLISTGLGYLGGVIEAVGKAGCTVVLVNPCLERWDEVHHASYREVWEEVLPRTRDPREARARFEPQLATRSDYIERYRFGHSFHPVHPVMALYPLKRLRHAGRVIVAGARNPQVAHHCGFEATATVEDALAEARASHGSDMSVALVDYPPAVNRS